MRSWLARDVAASFVVFLVVMPLCKGIAIASGVPPERGLLTGITGGRSRGHGVRDRRGFRHRRAGAGPAAGQ